jgi:uncharacterized protein involved in response to NO
MFAKIIGIIFSALVGRIMEWFKTNELEQQAALAQELKQHAESVIAAQANQTEVDLAVQAHQAAAAQVTEVQAQLDELRRWNQKSKELKCKTRELRDRSVLLKKMLGRKS